MLDYLYYVNMMYFKTWKGRNGRTKTINCFWSKKGTIGKWWLIPTVHYDHVFDPLTITFHFLKFEIVYHSVMQYTIEEFKKEMGKKYVDVNNVEPGYFEL